MSQKIIHGDCIEQLKLLEENSVDAIVTDPPYGLSFMGKKWDYDVPPIEVWKECLRVLKPGAFLLSFAGTRTYHRMVVNIEDAGFEIRDMISWLYGSGFPKSLNIGKQIDKMNGTEKIIGKGKAGKTALGQSSGYNHTNNPHEFKITEPNSPEAKEWEGWGTALKPACEPIVVARKPLSEKNVALNVLKWETGGINIDESRVETDEKITNHSRGSESAISKGKYGDSKEQENHQTEGRETQGRFPANIILDEEAGKILDEQTGELKSGSMKKGMGGFGNGEKNCFGESEGAKNSQEYNSSKGGASRFFYCAKASKSERNYGCEDMEDKQKIYRATANGTGEVSKNMERFASVMKNNHPTVKPIKLMEYLIKLVSREGATILDPFLGSGTTAIASIKLNRKFIGIEKEEEYIKIINARIKPFIEQTKLSSPSSCKEKK